jgi:hypothetical protein
MILIKKYGVWGALILTLAATVWVSQQEQTDDQLNMADEVASASDRVTATATTKNTIDQVDASNRMDTSASLMRRSDITEEPQNIFTPFIVADTLSVQNAAESEVQAPVNPFIYAGKLVEDGNVIVFLIDGDKNHAVKSGDVIEDVWQIKSIVPPVLMLKNIPSKIEIQLQIGALI